MRRVLLLEPVGGIAGDMFMAAAIDLGVDPEEITRALSGLKVPGWKLAVSRAERHAITGTHVDVVLEPSEPPADGEAAAAHPEHPAHPPPPPHHAHRSLADIRRLIDACETLSPKAKVTAQEIFTVIGEAEARIHSVPIERIHFHEVGAVDSIVDVCAAAFVHERLGVEQVLCVPPPLGSGQVRTQHGMMPVPAPATLEILRDVPVRFEGLGELTTPTGAAIIKVLATVGPLPPCTVRKVGYGVGTKDFRDRPNVLRASLAERPDVPSSEAGTGSGAPDDPVWVLEANLDDASPQLIGSLIEDLLEQGALDAFVIPAVMKKGRPGHLLSALANRRDRERLTDLLLRESTTLGVRFHRSERTILERRFQPVQTPWGEVSVKLGLRDGTVWNAQPEYEDCRRIAKAAGVPLKEVHAAALAALSSARSTE